MKWSEPANPRDLRNERNTICIQGSDTAAEISGYADIGMKKEALRLIRRVLAKRRILPEEFGEAVRTIGLYSSSENLKKWKPKLEAAYNRQSRRFKRKTRSYMVEMYGSIEEWEAVLPFVSIRRPSSASEILFGMLALIELDKLEDARVLATRCRRALSLSTDRFEQSLLLEALACFLARTHRWSDAIELWQHAPLDQPFRRNALSGIVKIHLARAFEAIESGLKALAELKRNPELSLCLPGNDLGMTQQAEKELLKFRRGIEKLLPTERRKELGIQAENNLDSKSWPSLA
jgi:hypothetical protein